MKKLIGYYLLIAIVLTPFIYSNNANEYRKTSGKSSYYLWGTAFGGAIYWPSYLFYAEPEVNSDSEETFVQSIVDIINYRNKALFTGARTNEHALMVFSSIGYCMISEGFLNENPSTIYKKLFSNKMNDKMQDVKKIIMGKMDGYDFSDIIEEGQNCKEENNL